MTSELFAKYDVHVPRYTSYPTVPEWHAAPTAAQWTASLQRALTDPSATLSLYIHLPFCASLCTFCGCNTVITRDYGRSKPYIDRVLRELDMYLELVPALRERPLWQVHLGGGTPTFASAEELAHLVDGILSRLTPAGPGRFTGSVEADPRVTSSAQLSALRERRFTRLSLGVQDFNEETQRLVNRIQSPALVSSLVAEARASGYESISFDLIYGLPGQTPASMQRLADEVLRMAPDRLAVYSFARVPWIKPRQRKFTDEQIPVAAEKRALYDSIRRPLLAAGYLELGMDHFARPHDALARAAAAGTLHRNFQGYTEARTNVLLGLGVSAISESADCYHQNEKVIAVYDRRIDRSEIPTHRGHLLSPDDRRRRGQIVAVMTRFAVTLDDAQAVDARVFLAPLLEDGLVVLEGNVLRVPTAGRAFIRNIASFFDGVLSRVAASIADVFPVHMTEARVIGAGLSGLATAWYLTERGVRVHVIEAAGSAGGLIHTLRTPEGLVETAAPAFMASPRVRALFSTLGVEACEPNPALKKRYIFRGGRPRRWPLSPLETSATLLRFGTAWISRRHRPRVDESLGEWGSRVLGRAGVDWLLAPVAGIYAASPDALSAMAILGGRRRGGSRISPRRGMQELVDRLVERLGGRGVRFSFNHRVTALDPSVPTAICTEAPAAACLLRSHAPRLAAALESIRMVSLVTVTAFFQPSANDLRGGGVLFPRSSKVGALGVLFNTDVFPDRSHLRSETWIYRSEHSVEAGFSRPDGVDEEDLRRQLEADRAVLTGRVERPVAVYITPRPNALPLYDAAVVRVAAAVEELPPTLALAGNYLGSLGVSRLVDGGAAAADRLLRVHGVTPGQLW